MNLKSGKMCLEIRRVNCLDSPVFIVKNVQFQPSFGFYVSCRTRFMKNSQLF